MAFASSALASSLYSEVEWLPDWGTTLTAHGYSWNRNRIWSCALGKPYSSELSQLDSTYNWAIQAPIEQLVAALRACSSIPLVAVGSGGSFTTADFAAGLHREASGVLATAQTPMEAVSTALDYRSLAVLLATAGGKNPDVLGAFQQLILREPRRFLVLCSSVGSPLSRIAAKYRYIDFIETDLPTGKDGFLATNSLLASCVLLARAYSHAMGFPRSLPMDLPALIGMESSEEALWRFDTQCRPLWSRDTLLVLYGPATRPAAIDLESKFSEAALGNVRVADYRNFAHGRHHWLAKRSDMSAVLAFVTPTEEDIASKTLAFVPASVPVLSMRIPQVGIVAGLAAVTQSLFIVGSAGRARGIDPGRPGVPGFGRKIYHLRAFNGRSAGDPPLLADEAAAIERKSRRSVALLAGHEELARWRQAYAAFVQSLSEATFRAIVFDYDGTLCDETDRHRGLSEEVGRTLTQFLKAGILLGIASGRGKSVRETLRAQVPKKYWRQVVVGYYNGGDIGLLDDGACPDGRARVNGVLRPIWQALQSHPDLSRLADFEPRLPQVKVEPKQVAFAEPLWAILQQVVHCQGISGITVVRSTHSMDVLAPGVSKRLVLDRVSQLLGGCLGSVLCIGDRGQWPGNDFSILSTRHALSVDEVSQDPTTCWNLAPAGHRGVQATIGYLARLRPRRDGLRYGAR